MRVLTVSHNVFSRTNNMGKTLMSYFSGFQPEEIAQFYIHSEPPALASVCRNYYQFTDKDALRSLIPLTRCGRVFTAGDIQSDEMAGGESGIAAAAYQFGTKRTGAIFAARNMLWKLARWNTKALWDWVDDFDPDVIFFASGDYSFAYDIALAVAEHTGKPLVVLCVDDHYLYNRNEGSALGRFTWRRFMKKVYQTMDRASEVFVISQSMKEEYEKLFGKPCRVLHTQAQSRELPVQEPTQISYIGNLGLKRFESLIRMGRALKELHEPGVPGWIDVYSGEKDPAILNTLTEENGIRFHGMASPDEVLEVMGRSMAVIHTESFDPGTVPIVRFSVSTKIAESLMYGPCLIAFGPGGIASVDYLKENDAAFVIDDPADLSDGLRRILTDEALRSRIVGNARALALKNHNSDINSANVRRWLEHL